MYIFIFKYFGITFHKIIADTRTEALNDLNLALESSKRVAWNKFGQYICVQLAGEQDYY